MLQSGGLTHDYGHQDLRSENDGSLAFVGSRLAFSDWILRVASAELGNIPVHRMDQLDVMAIRKMAKANDLRILFFDDAFVDEVLQRIDELSAAAPGVRFVFAYRGLEAARYLLCASRGRAMGDSLLLLPMNSSLDSWIAMLKLVVAGDFFVTGELAQSLCASNDAKPQKSEPDQVAEAGTPLTPRERQVLALVAEGSRNKSIARLLTISEHTVKLHLHNAIRKIGVRNRTEAAAWYLTRAAEADG